MAAHAYYTADMVRAIPDDGNVYEVVHGELLVSPAPRPWPEEVAGRLYETVRAYLRKEHVGHAYGSRSDLSWGLRDVLVAPDLFVVPLEEARQRRLYQERGVPLYWVIDPEERFAEIWRPHDDLPLIERRSLTWTQAGATTPFTLELTELFRPI
jgi:Uma2 family endonuclease